MRWIHLTLSLQIGKRSAVPVLSQESEEETMDDESDFVPEEEEEPRASRPKRGSGSANPVCGYHLFRRHMLTPCLVAT